ncbi:MAG: host attachment protein [Planctomycetota bacterium]|jgi:hypothetical protein
MTSRVRPPAAWIAIVDARCGRLLRRGKTGNGRLRLDETESIEERWEEREHGRPSMLGGKGRSYAPWKHEDEERRRRFARELARWLESTLARPEVETLDVYCSRTILGALRKALGDRTGEALRLEAGDLTDLSPVQLLNHPALSR